MPSLEENLDEEGCIYMLLTYFPTEYSRELKKKKSNYSVEKYDTLTGSSKFVFTMRANGRCVPPLVMA